MQDYDVAIVGAGPAGLSAALYAARYLRRTIVLHDGNSRTSWIPRSHNVPGYEDGVSGKELLDRMTRHAIRFGAEIVEAHVDSIDHSDGRFVLKSAEKGWTARTVIVATGLQLNDVPLDPEIRQAAILHGVLRYCPICDGYEHRDATIAVLGCDISGAAEALFMKHYSDDVTLIPRRDVELTKSERGELDAAGIKVLTKPVIRYAPRLDHIEVHLEGDDAPLSFGVLYPALGCRPANDLVKALGLPLNEVGKVDPSAPFETPIPGLYCAGDLVEGLDQISVAAGHGAIAATKAHNWLREREGETVHAVLDA